MNRRCVMIFLILLMIAAPAFGAKYKAPPDIVATLPQFCWAQYLDGAEDNPDFQIRGCGAHGNHYCPGLVRMTMAINEKTPGKRLEHLRRAKQEMEYTLRNTTNHPDCALRAPAQLYLERINLELEILKIRLR